jgi:hypothetical protein
MTDKEHYEKKIDESMAFYGAQVEILKDAQAGITHITKNLSKGLSENQRQHLQDIKLMLDVCEAAENGCTRAAEALRLTQKLTGHQSCQPYYSPTEI